MKMIIFLMLFVLGAFAQAPNVEKHPRVAEVEDRIRDEAARYFARRFPGEPFLVQVDVNPLRRVTAKSSSPESLPYFDSVAEEDLDEWDDPTTPITFLRHRVTKVTLNVSVGDKSSEAHLAEVREELIAYLKLLPYRDEVRVERKLKTAEVNVLPPYFYPVAGAIFASIILLTILLRWSIGGRKNVTEAAPREPVAMPTMAQSLPREQRSSHSSGSRTSADVRGDVTFHDPLKLMDIVHQKIGLIRDSGTFPTLKDMMTMHVLGENSPAKLGALIQCFPMDWQKDVFANGKGDAWLEAFAQPGSLDHEVLGLLDHMTRQRAYSSSAREKEDYLIQIWRMGERSINTFRKLGQDEAFSVLHLLPKTLSLAIAKKAFPGAWGRLLNSRAPVADYPADLYRTWLTDALQVYPRAEWKTLEGYKKDREILSYLDQVSVDEERDVYDSLEADSFVFSVRTPFYKVFDLEEKELATLVAKYPLEKWALVVMNSSRTNIRKISDVLDEKKKVVFSNHLRTLDHSFQKVDQIQWRKTIAESARELYPNHFASVAMNLNFEEAHEKTA